MAKYHRPDGSVISSPGIMGKGDGAIYHKGNIRSMMGGKLSVKRKYVDGDDNRCRRARVGGKWRLMRTGLHLCAYRRGVLLAA